MTLLEQTTKAFAERLQGVSDEGWGAPTPCAEWDVRTLVNHVVNELLWVPPLVEGQTIADVGDRFDGDVLGDDPKKAYAGAMAGALAAAGAPGAGERIVHLSFGDMPGSEYLTQIMADVTIHSWDLARGAGQDDALDSGLVDAVYAYMEPQADAWRAAGAFGPAVTVAADADTQTKLLALTGRDRAAAL